MLASLGKHSQERGKVMGQYRDVTDVQPLNDADSECLREIGEVLRRHGAKERFGLTLLHDHFQVAEDELLIEMCDIENRTLTIRPVRRSEFNQGDKLIETNWTFEAGNRLEPQLVCKVGCFVDLQDNHRRTHNSVQG